MSLPTRDGTDHRLLGPEAVSFGLVYAGLVAILLVVLTVRSDPALAILRALPSGIPIVQLLGRPWVWIVASMIALGVFFASVGESGTWGFSLGRETLPAVGLAVVGPVVVWLAVVLATALGVVAADPAVASGVVEPSWLWSIVVLPALLIGAGYGILVHGGLQGFFGARLGRTEALVAVVTLAGFYHWTVDPINAGSWLGDGPGQAVRVLLVSGFAVATAFAGVVLLRMDGAGSVREALAPRRVVVLTLGSVLWVEVVISVLSGTVNAREVLVATTWFAVFALAAWARERSDSVWPSVVAICVFEAAIRLTPTVEALLGLAGQ